MQQQDLPSEQRAPDTQRLDESMPPVVNSQSFPTRISTNYQFDAYNMPRINCFYHKGQTITNFCCCPQCLIPLCPLCINLHSQEHSQEGTFPRLESLEVVLNDIYQTMSSEANLFSDAYQDVIQHVVMMQQKSEAVHIQLAEVKARCIKVIEQFFHSLENDLYNKQKKNSDNQQRDAELLKALIQERWQSHMNFLEDLNSPSTMKSVIPFYGSSIIDDNGAYFDTIHQYLNRFQDVQSTIQFDQSRATELSGHLAALIQVKHNSVPDFISVHQLPHPSINQSRQNNISPQNPQLLKSSIKQKSIPIMKSPPSSNYISQQGFPQGQYSQPPMQGMARQPLKQMPQPRFAQGPPQFSNQRF